MACLLFSMLPDLDAIPGFLTGHIATYHNQFTHSLITGVGVGLLAVAVARLMGKGGFRAWFPLAFGCYGLHILMDTLTWGRGVMMLWPFSSTRYQSTIPIFRGVRWSEGIFSIEHVWTFLNEMAFGGVLLLSMFLIMRKKRC